MGWESKLSGEQIEQINAWIEAFADLAEVQARLDSELGIKVNYMETRFLVSDLGLEIRQPAAPEPDVSEDDELEVLSGQGAEPVGAAAMGGVQVTVDTVTPPHALIAGKVRFSDGEMAQWYLDQMGQLGLDADTPGYRPSEADLRAFQTELRAVLEREQGRMA